MSCKRLVFSTFASILSFSIAALATEVIEFPENELAQESVLPKFDRPDVVKSRNVVTAKKIEIAPFYGFVTTEPIYGQTKTGLNLAYHWSEESAFSLNYAMFSGGLNAQYNDQLKQNYNLDFSRAPKQKFALFGNYEYKAYYGKVSFTKQGTMNLSTYPIMGLGIVSYDTKSYPGFDFGIGQKFYFSKSIGLRIDYKFQYAQGPSPFLLGRMKTTDPVPQAGEFATKWTMNNLIDVGATILF